ncbi:MAG: ribosome biogenesis GTP-binding protein YihA/YsxC [Alphaproteobacteria bacterium]
MATRADKFFTTAPEFAFGVATAASMPPPHLPEFALIGRSNVGKSSLLNALTGQTRLAHVSATPGRTRQLNFYRIDRRCYLVDVPGYGFAKAPKEQIAAWQKLLHRYLRDRTTLKRIFALIDARHGITKTDHAMLDEIDRMAQGYQIILTKCDAVKPGELAATETAVHAALVRHPAAYPDMLMTSAERKIGIDLLRKTIFNYL